MFTNNIKLKSINIEKLIGMTNLNTAHKKNEEVVLVKV